MAIIQGAILFAKESPGKNGNDPYYTGYLMEEGKEPNRILMTKEVYDLCEVRELPTQMFQMDILQTKNGTYIKLDKVIESK